MRVDDALELVSGSLILVTGLGISAVAANQESFPGVFLGFMLFVVGYRISQFAAEESGETRLQDTVSDMVRGARLVHLLMTLVGIGGIGYGFILLFQSLGSRDLVTAAVGSGTMFLGYMAAHYGVNR
ncbi:MAG: hypothetical protein SVS85_04220, partial [Candidatus Nanohaloarchaea archaeon]|nr:hypothetical protein [Candidatus Nanohaloarchaea archaeon]